MATTVIIPARNEEVSIGDIIRVFNSHPETENRVYVGIDEDTVDDTMNAVWKAGGVPIDTTMRGKGQVVAACLAPIKAVGQMTPRVILCDADYTGLTTDHVNQIISYPQPTMVVGVPDWPDIDVPRHVIQSWPWVSGFRCLPNWLIPEDAHGYLLETQLNVAAIKRRLPAPFVFMQGLKSPFHWPLHPKRMEERERDREWGKANGIL